MIADGSCWIDNGAIYDSDGDARRAKEVITARADGVDNEDAKVLAVDKGQVVAGSALKTDVLIIVGHATIGDATCTFPYKARQTFLAIVRSVVVAVGRNAVEVDKHKTWVALSTDADTIVAQGKTSGAVLAGQVSIECLAI